MTSSVATAGLSAQARRPSLLGRIDRWLNAMPHPSVVVEIAAEHVAAARWGVSRGSLDSAAVEPLPAGSLMPSPIEPNVTQPEALKDALRSVFNKVGHRNSPLALLVPDPAVRVFILPFDSFPRKAEEALPLLRWKLKKSVPFDVDETSVSWMRQNARDGNLEIVATIARQRILREYEDLLESMDAWPGVVLSSSLAVVPLLDDAGATLLARLCGSTLTTAIVHGASLCVYRSTQLAAGKHGFDPQAVLNEVFPAAAYFQDTWGREIDRAYLSGFSEEADVVRAELERDLNVPVKSISEAATARELNARGQSLFSRGLDSLAGWAMNGGS